tara:strand:- start:1566 stop:2099 length:534 start_codon:yes stop_codon:yes gene_type:complete
LSKVNIIIIICLCFYSTISIPQTIAVVNIQNIIDNNSQYVEILKEIENSQIEYFDDFEIKENELKEKLKDLESSKLILSENEINNQIDLYNKELNVFTNSVDAFNLHYQNQIINIREKILKEIISLLEKYALNNKIDLILDSTTYLIASNSINITNNINEELREINLKLEYENFEKN